LGSCFRIARSSLQFDSSGSPLLGWDAKRKTVQVEKNRRRLDTGS